MDSPAGDPAEPQSGTIASSSSSSSPEEPQNNQAPEGEPNPSGKNVSHTNSGDEKQEQAPEEDNNPENHQEADPKGKNASTNNNNDENHNEEEEEEESSPPGSAEAMDESLWSNLPEHLLDFVLARLPVATFLRLRTVCKKWSTAATSRNFLHACSAIKSRPPYLLIFADHFHRRVAAIFDTELHKWHLLPFSNFMKCRFPESFLVLAAAGGLLCLEGTGSQSGNMFVSNPVTKRWRKLPRMIPMKSPYVVGMITDERLESYQILVAQDGETLASQLYDSSTDRWEIKGVFRKQTAIVAGATLVTGLLYCLTLSPSGLLAFDPVTGQWDEVKAQLPGSLTCPNLMTRHGKLLLIGGVEEFGRLTSVHIWELHPGNAEWSEVMRLPDDVFKRLFTSASGHFICVGSGDFICLHEYYSREILLLDMVEDSWSWLPACLLNDYIEARSVLGLAFQPRIEAIPYESLPTFQVWTR